MNIVIVGNMGYVGSVLSSHLRAVMPDAVLTGIDSAWFAHCLTGADTLPEKHLNHQKFADTRDLSSADFDGVDAVIQLAAVSNDPMGKRFEDVTDDINHRAAVHVATCAAQAKVQHFVFASSCSVYGFAADGRARTEQDEINPLTAYARSKIATEQALAKLSAPDMTISCLRFATACGMSPRLRLDLVLNDFVAGALSSNKIEVLSDGSPWRPLINVKDMARAIEWGISRTAANGGRCLTLNVGANSWNYQVRDLALAVKNSISATDLSINQNAPPDKRSYQVDFGLYASLAPDHQPQETLETTIVGLRDGLKTMHFNDREFRNSSLIRLRVLERFIKNNQLSDSLRWTGKNAV